MKRYALTDYMHAEQTLQPFFKEPGNNTLEVSLLGKAYPNCQYFNVTDDTPKEESQLVQGMDKVAFKMNVQNNNLNLKPRMGTLVRYKYLNYLNVKKILLIIRHDVYEWLMFKTEDSEDQDDESIHYDGIDNEDIVNGNIEDCFEDINRNFVTPTSLVSEYGDDNVSDYNNGNLILIGELNVLKV